MDIFFAKVGNFIQFPTVLGIAVMGICFIKMSMLRERAKKEKSEVDSAKVKKLVAIGCTSIFLAGGYGWLVGTLMSRTFESRFDQLLFSESASCNLVKRSETLPFDKSDTVISSLKKSLKVSAHHSSPEREMYMIIHFSESDFRYGLYRDSQESDEYWIYWLSYGDKKISDGRGIRVSQVRVAGIEGLFK